MSRMVDLEGLPESVAKAIEDLVRANREALGPPPSNGERRSHGWLKGWSVPDSAFAPLTDEELEEWHDVEKFKRKPIP